MANENNAAIMWNFFKSKTLPNGSHLSDAQIAGILGNGEQESGFEPSADSGNGFYGLFQWGGGRQDNLRRMTGAKLNDLYAQLEFAWDEWTNGGYESQMFMRAMNEGNGTPEDYARLFRLYVERPSADDSESRQAFARKRFDMYNGGYASGGQGFTGSTMDSVFAPAAQAMGNGYFDPNQDIDKGYYDSSNPMAIESTLGAIVQNFIDSEFDAGGVVNAVNSLYGMIAHSGGKTQDLTEETVKTIKSSLPNDKSAQEFIMLNAVDNEHAQYLIQQKQQEYQRKAALEDWKAGNQSLVARIAVGAAGAAGYIADPTMLLPTLGGVVKLRTAARLGDGLLNLSKAERLGNFAVRAGTVGTDAVIGTMANDVLLDKFSDKEVHYGQDAAAAFLIGSALGALGGLAGAYKTKNPTIIKVAEKLDDAETNVYKRAAGIPSTTQMVFSKEAKDKMTNLLRGLYDEKAEQYFRENSPYIQELEKHEQSLTLPTVATTWAKARDAIEKASGVKLGEDARGFYSPSTGIRVLFADKIPEQEVDGLFIHEKAHAGLKALLGDKRYSQLMNSVTQLRKKKGNDFYVASHRYGTTDPEEIVAYVLQDNELKFPERTLKSQVLDVINKDAQEAGFATRFDKEGLIKALKQQTLLKNVDIPVEMRVEGREPVLFSDLQFSKDSVGGTADLLTYGTSDIDPTPYVESDLAQGKILGHLPSPLQKGLQWFGRKVENGYLGEGMESRSPAMRAIMLKLFNDPRGRGKNTIDTITAEDNMLRISNKLNTYIYNGIAPLETQWMGKFRINKRAADLLWWKMVTNAFDAKYGNSHANVVENVPEEVNKAVEIMHEFFAEELKFGKHSATDVGSDAPNLIDGNWYAVDNEMPRFVDDDLRAKFITENYVSTSDKTALQQAKEDLKAYILKAVKRRGEADDPLKLNSVEGQILREKKMQNARIDKYNETHPAVVDARNAEKDVQAQKDFNALSDEERRGYVPTQADRDAWIASQDPNYIDENIIGERVRARDKVDTETKEMYQRWLDKHKEEDVLAKLTEERAAENAKIEKQNEKAFKDLIARNRRALNNGTSTTVPAKEAKQIIYNYFYTVLNEEERVQMSKELKHWTPHNMIAYVSKKTGVPRKDITEELANELAKKSYKPTDLLPKDITKEELNQWYTDHTPASLQKRMKEAGKVDTRISDANRQAWLQKNAPKVYGKQHSVHTPKEHIPETVTDEEIEARIQESLDDMVDHMLGDYNYDPSDAKNVSELGDLQWLRHRLPMDTSFSMPLRNANGLEFSFDNNLRSYEFSYYLPRRIRRFAGELSVKNVFGTEKNLQENLERVQTQLQNAAKDGVISEKKAQSQYKNLVKGINALRGVATGEEDIAGKAQVLGSILRGLAYFKNGANMGINQIAEAAGTVAYGGVSQMFSFFRPLQKLIDDVRIGKIQSEALEEMERSEFGTRAEYQLFPHEYVNYSARKALQEKTIANKTLTTIADGIHNLSQITSFLNFLPKTTEWMVRSMRKQTILDSIRWASEEKFSKVHNPFSKAKLKAANVTEEDTKAIKENLAEFIQEDKDNNVIGIDFDAWKAKDMHSYLQWYQLIELQAERAIVPTERIGNTNLFKNNHGAIPQILLQFKDYSLRSMNAQTMRALTSGELDDAIAAGLSVITNTGVYIGRKALELKMLLALGAVTEEKAKEMWDEYMSDENLLRAVATRSAYAGTPLSFANDLYEVGWGADTVRTSVQRTKSNRGADRNLGDVAKDAVGQIPALQNLNNYVLGAYSIAREINGNAKDRDFDRIMRILPVPNWMPFTSLMKMFSNDK